MDEDFKVQRKWLLRLCLPLCLAFTSFAHAVSPGPPSVIVPVLVENRSGEIAFELSAMDFSIRDNGVEEKITLQDDMDVRPLSLLIVIQTGRQAGSRLDALRGLSDLLGNILTGPADQAAVLTFDSRPHVVQGFTADSDSTSRALASVGPGDSGASLADALHLGIPLLDKTPAENRRIVLLISGERDHGSNDPDVSSLIQLVSSRDVSLYGLSFSAPRGGMLDTLRAINPLAAITNEMQRNMPKALAQLTGGDFYRFDRQRTFENGISQIANHIHNTYCLAFNPHDPQPGFHSLQVTVYRSKTNVISARSGYWVGMTDGARQ